MSNLELDQVVFQLQISEWVRTPVKCSVRAGIDTIGVEARLALSQSAWSTFLERVVCYNKRTAQVLAHPSGFYCERWT